MPSFSRAKPQSTSTPQSAKSLAPATKGKHENPLAVTSNHLQVEAAPQISSNSKALLGLLQNYKGAAPAPEIVSERATKQPLGRPEASMGLPSIVKDVETPRHVTFTFGDENASIAPTGNPKRKRVSPLDTPRKKAAEDDGLARIDKACERLAANRDSENKARSETAATEASINNTLRSRPASPSISENAQLPPEVPLVASINSVPKFPKLDTSQILGQGRVSRRDVNIPKDQEVLLNRADCRWFRVILDPIKYV